MESQQETKDVPPVEQIPAPSVTPLPQKRKLGYLILLSIVLFLIIGLVILFITQKPLHNKSQTATVTKQSVPSKTKEYINSFYHIKFNIPFDWVSEETKKPDGVITFILASSNDEISITSPIPQGVNELINGKVRDTYHEKTRLQLDDIQLGKNTVQRHRYINDFDQIIDTVSLYNIPNQQPINFSITITGDFEKNNNILLSVLKTFAFIQEEPTLDSLITYTLPNGWKKEELNPANDSPDKTISLISPDIEESAMPSIITGARIRIYRILHDPGKTLKEEIIQRLPLPHQSKNVDIVPITISSRNGLNNFICWEGCYDEYFVLENNYVWIIDFNCTPSLCSTKSGMDASPYAPARDTFLNSFKL